MAMTSAFSGCQVRTVPADRGILTWAHIQPAIGPKIYYRAQTALICLENSHNMAGGTVTPLPILEEIWAGAREAGLPVHLDGARVFNAATALNLPVATLASGFDTVMFCLSKGLGAPVGSMLVGSKKAIEQARIHRKALGGGMRQAGILAAAGLIALHEMPKRLPEDHANARLLAEAVAAHPKAAEIDLAAVQTNIVIFKLNNNGDAAAFTTALKQKEVLASAIGPHSVRFVTHYDVDRTAIQRAAKIISDQLASLN
jgi:threonine aldolase